MIKVEEVNWTIAVILDICSFTTKDHMEQVSSIEFFVRELVHRLEGLEKLSPDAFSTGDGAIITIGRQCQIDKNSTKAFLDFVIGFVIEMQKRGLSIRAAINYSERDKIITISHVGSIQGEFIQIGDTINTASRIISFAEVGEILVNNTVCKLLDNCGLKQYSFKKNERFITKHGEEINSYSYVPKREEKKYLYNPDNPVHQYKKYSFFPAINIQVVEYFYKTGLLFELNNLCANLVYFFQLW